MKIIISLISFYQKIVSPLIHQLFGLQTACRYKISCSEYTKMAFLKYGFSHGLSLGMKRVLSCQPYFHSKNMVQSLVS